VTPAATPSARVSEVEDNRDNKTALKKPGKKKKKGERQEEKQTRLMLSLVIGGSVLVLGALITLLVLFIPWGKMMANKDVQVVDVYTAINGLRVPTIGQMHNLSTFSIPGRMKILVTRPNPQGQYLIVHLKLPYQDVEDYYHFAKGRYILDGRMIHFEVDGEQYNSMLVQTEEDHTKGYFDLDYSPKGNNPRPLTDYIGPKSNDWTHEGERHQEDGGFVFNGASGMKVTVGRGSGGRQGGDLRVSWNEGCDGWVVDDSLEQPNELNLNWELTLLFQKPKTAGKEVTLKVLNKTKKLKLP
jgi:hypothetical protein